MCEEAKSASATYVSSLKMERIMMFKSALTAFAALFVASVANAQEVTERATTPPRGGPRLALALEAVQTA